MSVREMNSWHYLAAALAASLAVSGWFWTRAVARETRVNRPRLVRQTRHLAALQAMRAEQVEELERARETAETELAALRRAVTNAAFQPLPVGQGAVIDVKNALDRALAARGLRTVSREVAFNRKTPPQKAPPRSAASPAPLPFKTEEVPYVVEGTWRDIFLFLVRETQKKPSYHLKDLTVRTITPTSLRLTFTAQINWLDSH